MAAMQTHDKLERFIRHPSVDKTGKVEGRGPIEVYFIVDELVRSSTAHAL